MGEGRWGSAWIWDGAAHFTGESSGLNYTRSYVYTVA